MTKTEGRCGASRWSAKQLCASLYQKVVDSCSLLVETARVSVRSPKCVFHHPARPNGARWTISIPLASRESAANFAGTDKCILLPGVGRPKWKIRPKTIY